MSRLRAPARQALADHDLGLELLEYVKASEEQDAGIAKGMATSVEEHRDVIVRFGRYPHRNAALGRESTPEEEEWLASPDLPGFARSQVSKPES